MDDPFHSSKYLLGYAKDHVADFERQVRQFFASNPCSTVIEIDPNTAEEVYKVKLVKAMPDKLPGIAFDTVNGLRSALDHACHACAIAGGRKGDYAAFPFADRDTSLDSQIKGRSKEVPVEIQDLIRTFKPYKGGDDLLWALNALCNTNKHAIVCPVVFRTGSVTYSSGILREGGAGGKTWDRLKNELELARVRPGGTFEANFNIAANVMFCDVEFVDGEQAIGVLHTLAGKVNSIVLAIEAKAKGIGLIKT